MTSVTIKNSTNGNIASVDSSGNLSTKSVMVSGIKNVSATTQQSFLISTGFVTETTAGTEYGALYIKNTATDKNLFIKQVRTCASATTPSTTLHATQWRLIKNPTAGTLISDTNNANSINLNLSSNKTFSGLAYAASGAGKTVTDGTAMGNWQDHLPGHSLQPFDGALELGTDDAIAIKYNLSVAGDVCVEVHCWFESSS